MQRETAKWFDIIIFKEILDLAISFIANKQFGASGSSIIWNLFFSSSCKKNVLGKAKVRNINMLTLNTYHAMRLYMTASSQCSEYRF